MEWATAQRHVCGCADSVPERQIIRALRALHKMDQLRGMSFKGISMSTTLEPGEVERPFAGGSPKIKCLGQEGAGEIARKLFR
jgi:hypothetical protein